MRSPEPEPQTPPGSASPDTYQSDSVVRQFSPVPSDGMDYSETVQCHVSESVMYSGDNDRYETVLETQDYIETPKIENVAVEPQHYQQDTQIESKETVSSKTPTNMELEPPVDRARSISPGGKYRSQDLSYAEILALGLRKQATTQSITSMPKPQTAQVEMVKEIIVEVEKSPQAPVEYKVPSRESSKYRSERRERPSQRSRSRDMPRQRRAPEKRPTKSHDVQTLKKKKTSRKVIEVQEFEETPETVNPEPIVSERIPHIQHKIIENVKSEHIKKSDISTNISETNKSDIEDKDSEIALEPTHKKHKKKQKPKKFKDSEDEIEKALKEIEISSKQKKKKIKNINEHPKDTVDITVTNLDQPEKKKASKQIKSEVTKEENVIIEKEIFNSQTRLDGKCEKISEAIISQTLIESESKKCDESSTENKVDSTKPLETEELKTKKKKKSKKIKSTVDTRPDNILEMEASAIQNYIKDESSQIDKSGNKSDEKLLDKEPKVILKEAVKESLITMDWNALMEEEENIPESSLSLDAEKINSLKEIPEQVATEIDILPEKESQAQDTNIDGKEIILELYESSILPEADATLKISEEQDFHHVTIQDKKSNKSIEAFVDSDSLLEINSVEKKPLLIGENIIPKDKETENKEICPMPVSVEQNLPNPEPEQAVAVEPTVNIHEYQLCKNVNKSSSELVQNTNEEELIPVNIEGEQNNNDKFFLTEPLKEVVDVVQEVTTYEPQEVDTHTIYLITHEEKKLPPIRTLKVYCKEVSNDKIQTPDNESNVVIEEQSKPILKDNITKDSTIDEAERIEISLKPDTDQSIIETDNLQLDDKQLNKNQMETEIRTSVQLNNTKLDDNSEEVLEQAIFGSVQERKKPELEKIISIPYKELVEEVKTYSVDLDFEQLDYNYYELKKKELDYLQLKDQICNVVEHLQTKKDNIKLDVETIPDQEGINENDLIKVKSETTRNISETYTLDPACSSTTLNIEKYVMFETPSYAYQYNADSEKLLGVMNSSKKEQVQQLPLESSAVSVVTHLADDDKNINKLSLKSDEIQQTTCNINIDQDINIKHLIEDIPRQNYHDICDSEKLFALSMDKSLQDFKNDEIENNKTEDLINSSLKLIQENQRSQAEALDDKITTKKIIKDYVLDSNVSYDYQDIKRGEELLAIKSSREHSVEPMELTNQADLFHADGQDIDTVSVTVSNAYENKHNQKTNDAFENNDSSKIIEAETSFDKDTAEQVIKDYILDGHTFYNYQDLKRGEELLAVKSSREHSVEPLELTNQADLLHADSQDIGTVSVTISNAYENKHNQEENDGFENNDSSKIIEAEISIDKDTAEQIIKDYILDGHTSYNYQDLKRGEELLAVKSSREHSVEPLELTNQKST
ncbi:claspin-like [Zerene cesonia]|uniref:claspin-like n=1 Tax=Zerene cesonia TaxID=33412 RepID=UPI0018E5A6F7|nr:claspin-like [Zerene cesonia]